jgi:uncharacterized protein DUF4255/carboxypeptidase family protein
VGTEGVLEDLDETLRNMLDDAAAPGTLRTAQVSFVTPDKNFTPTDRTVDLFLYELKENRELRDPEPIVERTGATFVRRRPPVRVDCSYLVTAWSTATGPAKVVEEHELLGLTFQWMSRFPTIPPTFFAGDMAGQPFPPPTLVAQMDGAKSTAEFWSALGTPPRPYFNLVATIAVPLGVDVPEGPPVATKDMRLLVKAKPASQERWFQIGGTVRSAAAPNAPVAGATVLLVERDESRTTDAQGRFTFSPLPAGAATLKVTATGFAEKKKAVAVPSTAPDEYDVMLTP